MTKDVAPYTVVAGTPARILKTRFDARIIERLLALQWWRYSIYDMYDVKFQDISLALDQITQRIEENVIQPYEPEKLTPEKMMQIIALNKSV